ncbi:DELLA protein RGL1-like [Neltuma alba]|uniref:DELLA protein RGL1-like n=1 Tax=Neltuma alba TaxID=207710 RepID=UPI0010A2F6A9|nr:DELLA protein RGL1-like [Prosopis alba]
MGDDAALNCNGTQGGHKFAPEEAVFHEGNSLLDMKFTEEMNALPIENHEKETYSHQNRSHEPKFDDLMLEEFSFDFLLQPPQAFEETVEVNNKAVASSESVKYNDKPVPPASSILASLELLNNYKSRLRRLKGQNINDTTETDCSVGRQKLSTAEIIRVTGERYVQFSAYWDDNTCMPTHPYGFGLGGLSDEENKDVELAQFLLTAAERVSCEQYEGANRILLQCELNSSACATPVQKIVYHFAQALRERIHKETGMVTTLDGYKKTERHELLEKINYNLPFISTCFRKIPFCQAMQIAGVQAMIEHLASGTKIHLIDLEIRWGVQWTALMQALAERRQRPLQLLTITAIGFEGRNELEETGECLADFAGSLNLPFSFKVVFVTDMIEIREEQFEINDDEAVAVYAPCVLATMIPRPECLENLMSILRKKKPRIMIVHETEANSNSQFFGKRFVEALFFFSAYIDCTETCMKDEAECRVTMGALFSDRIRNVVAREGKERTQRHVKVDVWRRFFARYRVVETSFSESSL